MTGRVVKVPLSEAGVDRAIRCTRACREWLKQRSATLLARLTGEGYQIASAGFARAVYDGTDDVRVTVEERDSHTRALVAVGGAVLFIEFGSGVTYADTHPEAAQQGMTRGGYGQGKGKRAAWGYYGDPGSNGQVKTKANGREVVITRGNPANMSMYETAQALKDLLPGLAREVFR